MSLTSYRAAPPRVCGGLCVVHRVGMRGRACDGVCWWSGCICAGVVVWCGAGVSRTWRRPTFPHLRMQYHRRWGFSRPSSGWDRVRTPRHGHQVTPATPGRRPGGAGQVLVRGGAACVRRRASCPGTARMIAVHGGRHGKAASGRNRAARGATGRRRGSSRSGD